nr:PREDICTED: stabilin-2-like [Paralichthys olivaceus]
MSLSVLTKIENFCSKSTVLRTRTSCHSCSISLLISCPSGFKRTPHSMAQDCRYHIKTASLKLPISGCSFECYREVELKSCCPGYWGPDCVECPDRADRPCSDRGICSDGLGGNGTCTCQEGFAGTSCEDCSPGRFGSTCSSECSCLHGLCDSGLKGDGHCTCFSGYKGPNCEKEVPECAALRCRQNSRCMEEALTGQLVCQCLPGHQMSGDQCLSINPCLQRVCHTNASCIHTGPNQHLCACNEGYIGDGRVCMAIDPCQTKKGGCSTESTQCIYDGPGKSHCECLPGFNNLSNGGCSLKDVCRPGSCHKKANCSTVGPGQVECTCLQGYIGNGKVCYGNIVQRLNELNTEPGGQWRGQLSNAIELFGLLSWPLQNLGPFTVFIPINKGFKGTLVRILLANSSRAEYLCKMHLVAGVMPFDTLKKTNVFFTLTGKSAGVDTSEGDAQTKIRIHGSRKKGVIIQSDIVASNGMIHLINKLMDSVTPTVESNPEENLMKIISDYGKFDKFKTLLEKTQLASILDLPGPITVFAPTSLAFDTMSDGHLTYLSSTEGHNKLVELLRNHIIPSTALEVFNAVSSPRIVTKANQVLTINVTENGQILVNGAAVLESAVEAKNGRLYVLDGVLTPPSIEPVLPHRCDITETKIVRDECVSCLKIKVTPCSSGVDTGLSRFGCLYMISVGSPPINVPATGCSLLCNTTVTTPACCKGFYGPDCRPCPGGYQTPCSGHGQCMEGITGNGSCICDPNFQGSRCHFCSRTNKHGPRCDMTCLCAQGQCDNRPDSGGRCKVDSCLPGFTGPLCDRQTAACGIQAQFCHAHADCDFSQGTTRCVCKPGYQGDGITCVESDPCAPPLRGGCSVNAKCIKTGPGTHSCQCLTGWREDGDECQPINNCDGPDTSGCHPNATCIYVGPGQSDCSCKHGYKGNGRDCEAVNPCVTMSGGCHYLASCLLLSSQWTCVCDEGYVGDGRMCFGSVEQELMVLPETSEFFKWTTDSGVSLLDQNVTLLVPSSAAVDKMSSDDKNFWTTKGNLPSLIRNHMIPGNYPSSSLNPTSPVTSLLKTTFPVSTANELTIVGGATIITSDIAATNGLIHIIDKVLVPDRKLSEGLLATLALRPEFSLFRSYLIDYNLTDEIEQGDEFTVFAPTDAAINDYLKKMAATALDVNTTRYHVVAAERLLKTDLQPGGYKQTLLGFSFQLAIMLREGKLLVNDAQINSSNILSGNGVIHGLSAVLKINRNRCDEATYQKVMATCVDCLFPIGKICPNNSVPDKSMRSRKCMFSRMFEGEQLLTIGCRPTCLQKNIVRACCGGFFGKHCEPCPGLPGQPCFGNGACMDGTNGTGVCQCNQGFNGTACETCQSGKYGVHCDQDCRCKNGRCNEGVMGDGTCECDVGWRGILCDEKVESAADELCGSVKCHTSANCLIGLSGPLCFCAAGFQGNGTSCRAKDPCVEDNGRCSLYAVCKRTRPGRRACVCYNGYYGDGLVCVEINPCLEGNGGCHANADCVHVGPNKTSCSCSEGYSGDGQNCHMINLCQKKNGGCHQFARCNMSGPGVRTCTCKSNFLGDGLTCKGTVDKEILTRKLRDFYIGLMMVEISLKGRGPFTVFPPSSNAFTGNSIGTAKMKSMMLGKHKEQFATVLRSHIVMCHTLLPTDLSRPRNLTSLSGLVLSTRSSQGNIFINGANVTYSHDVSVNGIFHEIDKILFPPDLYKDLEPNISMNLTDVAERHGYTHFYKLLEVMCPGGVGSPCSNRGKCDDGHLGNGTCTCDVGFRGVACEQCSDGFFGPTCKSCNCSEHGSCDDGWKGTGACLCEAGWSGELCDTEQSHVSVCSPPCSPKAVCTENNTCVCRPFYEGDGFTCTVADMCGVWNGGCAKGAKCSQIGELVTCTCPKGHSGDGFTCQPVDPCVSGDNGGCHEHATCTMMAPGKKKCTCKDNYIGDGETCEVKQLPISRCLQGNGRCHQDAKCTDLHFEDATLGVFHLRSDRGQYKLNFSAAQQACSAEGGDLATYMQLSYAQQGGLNMCAAGWLDQARVAYPTTYSNPNCGFGHVGIVDYGVRKNLSESWDVFCYQMKEVRCECQVGYVGDGFRCTGNLLQVLMSTPTFSNFLTQILNCSQVSSSGKQFVERLSNLTVQSTLFVPDNDGLPDNQTLSQWDIEFHLSEGRALPLSELKNGSRIRTRVGSLRVLGVSDLLDPSALSSRYINDRFVTNSDIVASNGIIHVLQGPLKATPPRQEMHVGHKAGMGVGVTLLVILVVAGMCVGYNFYKNNNKGFQFHYFKEDEEEETVPPAGSSICNPVYEAAPESKTSYGTAKQVVADGGSHDLLQDG